MTVQLVPTDLEAAPQPLSRARTAVQSSPAAVAGARVRLGAIDTLRGAVMAIMVLDHCRDYLHASAFDPRDVSQPALFLTRWVTHFCAPIFVFLAGISAYLYGARAQSPERLQRFLWTRGLWLIVLELTVVRLGWTFGLFSQQVIFQVIWALGASMVVLAALVRLPRWVPGALAVVLIAGHNMLDGVRAAALGDVGWLWVLLHQSSTLTSASGWTLWALYPLIPWVGVLAAGYALGPVFQLAPAPRRRVLLALGLGLLALFVTLRAGNAYGDPRPWSARGDALQTLLAFLDCEKYPPSLLYLAMTLGPALLVLAALSNGAERGLRWLTLIGRVPLFYYVLHIYAVHALAVVASWLWLGHADWLFGVFPPVKPAGFGFSLPVVYALTLLVVAGLALACRWYGALKSRRSEWWWSYL